MQNSKKIKVDLTFSWEFDKRDWSEMKQHEKEICEEITQKTNYDHLNMFYHLNDMVQPTLTNMEVGPS
jgi:hypothetical protein